MNNWGVDNGSYTLYASVDGVTVQRGGGFADGARVSDSAVANGGRDCNECSANAYITSYVDKSVGCCSGVSSGAQTRVNLHLGLGV